MIEAMSARGLLYARLIGVCTGSGYVAYITAFKAVGSPSLHISYFTHLSFNPWFILAVILSGSTVFLRPFVFEAVGASRGYWILAGIGAVAASFIVVMFLRERMEPLQWIGAFLAECGSILVAAK